MTSTIKFYSLPKDFKDKNAIFDSNFETYLNRYNTFTITNFQYIKNQLRLSIKVALNQDHSQPLFNQQDHIDYVRILNQGAQVEEIPYYYFVINQRWKGEETVELELEMDTLNTFKGYYTLSNKTLITREHKDRFAVGESSSQYTFSFIENNVFDLNSGETYYLKNFEEFTQDNNFSIQTLGRVGKYAISIYDESNNRTFYQEIVASPLASYLHIHCSQGTIALYVNISNPSDVSGDTPILYLDEYLRQGYKIGIRCVKITSSFGNSAYESSSTLTNYFAGYVEETPIPDYYKRIIDKVPEGINPILFKKSESILLDKNGMNNWYLLYANNNNIQEHSEGYVNPVNLFLVADFNITYTAMEAITRTIFASSLPNYSSLKEVLIIRYKDGNGSAPVITINNSIYFLADLGNGNNDYSAIVFYRGSSTNRFDNCYGLVMNSNGYIISRTSLATNFESFDIIGANYGYLTAEAYGRTEYTTSRDGYSPDSNYYIGSGENTTTGTFNTIDEVDFTQSQLLKCIALPYAPLEALSNITNYISSFPSSLGLSTITTNFQGTFIKLLSLTSSFDYVINFGLTTPYSNLWIDYGTSEYFTPASKQARNISRESKLYSSEFYSPKFVYDSFVFDFNLEYINTDNFFATDFKNFYVRYVVSKNLTSKFMFQFTQYITDIAIDNYENILVVERNNEKALYNNDYVNYIRGGYNFDIKNKNRAVLTAGVNLGASIVGGTLQTALGSEFGIAQGIGTITSAFTGLFNNIMNAKAMDTQISQKLDNSSRSKTSVIGADDIDILEAYSSNKAKLCFYECSDIMKEELYNFFYYCGYATHRYGAIDSTSRLYFNFVQANIDYSYTNNIPSEILEDIKMKYGEGVMFMHYVDSDYDLDFRYENWETSLL